MILTHPVLPEPATGFAHIAQAWLADRKQVKLYRKYGPYNTCLYMRGQTCFFELPLVPNVSTVHYVPVEGGYTPVYNLVMPSKAKLQGRVFDDLPQASLVLIVRMRGSEDYLVSGLTAALTMAPTVSPTMQDGMAQLNLVIHGTAAMPMLWIQPVHFKALLGLAPIVTSIGPTVGAGVFTQGVRLSGQWLYGTRQVWWGEEPCAFTLDPVGPTGEAYDLIVYIKAGEPKPPSAFSIVTDFGIYTTTQTYQRS